MNCPRCHCKLLEEDHWTGKLLLSCPMCGLKRPASTFMPLEPEPVVHSDSAAILVAQINRLKKDVQELNARAIQKTNDYLESSTRLIYRIRELETAMSLCKHECSRIKDFLPDAVKTGLNVLDIALKKNKEHYQ